ncbi:MAG: glycine betaine/L-proline ABC transporter ATP-binding protein [Chloroflexota bacterium]
MPTKIRIEHVTKIFGDTPDQEPLSLLQSGVSKDEILQRTGHVVGLADVSLTVDEGEIFVVMGLSGSGKSTLIRTVNRLIDPTTGHIYVDDEDVAAASDEQLRELRRTKMSMVFQHFGLFPHKTVLENASYGLKVRGMREADRHAKALESLRMVGLGEWGDYYPHNLSGGMQQRVGLARALAADTDILLMDEAFSALDPLIRGQMQEELLGLQETLKKTILFITHDLNEALRVGSRIAVMRDGAVVQIGTPIEIVTQPADKYVADFTQDVDLGRVLTAQFVMQAADTLTAAETETAMSAGRATAKRHTPLVDLYAMVKSGHPVAIMNNDGTLAGIVSAQDVLTGLAFRELQGAGE